MSTSETALIALTRFGLGARPGDVARIASDPRGALLAELKRGVVVPSGSDLLDSPAALSALRARDERDRIARAQVPPAATSAMAAPMPASPAGAVPVLGDVATTAPSAGSVGFRSIEAPLPAPVRAPAPTPSAMAVQPDAAAPASKSIASGDPGAIYLAEAKARLAVGMGAELGFVERLVWFWSNHFAVSALKGGNLRVLVGAYEREAIRPHVLGRFADLVWAAETHPAMLLYLDNQGSVGPGSPAGQRRGRGLNENLGREILELHTLGVGGGYDQGDVTNLARILTGWTVVGPEGRLGRPGTAAFNVNAHEPGPQTVLGRSYEDFGPDQLRAALADVARHPSTARHVATKLARHFVTDEPPPALVDRLARCFRDTDGDLLAVSTMLVQSPEAWVPERRKVRLPAEFIVAAARLLGAPAADPRPIVGGIGLLGEPLWSPQGPNGFTDTVATWASPEGLKVRLDIAWRAAQRLPTASPAELLDAAFGGAASAATREAVLRAESRQQAVALLLMAPEFQRR